MFNSFPIPKPDSGGGLPSPFDWSAYQTVYNLTGSTQSVPANSWATFLNVTGKGFFKWCRVSDNGTLVGNPNIRLTIDGQVYLFDGVVFANLWHGNEINFEIPFTASLKIEAFNSHGSSTANFICDYLYLLQQSMPNPRKITLTQQSQRKMAYYGTSTTVLADVVNITGSGYLLGIRFLGHYLTASANISGDINIDGIQKMTDRILFNTGNPGGKQSEVVAPIRFSNSLRIRTRTDVAGSVPICFAWYSLD